MPLSVPLSGSVTLRELTVHDVDAVLAAYERNRGHLLPWEPTRPDDFFTTAEQTRILTTQVQQRAAGTAYPLVLVEGDTVIGRLTLSGIVRGPFQSASVGYWIDADHAGRGLATAALRHVVTHSRDRLGLHRLEAGTLLHNEGSQKVLANAGFEPIGVAQQYLQINGTWQDHLLFQRILGH